MKILVCGGRTYTNAQRLFAELDKHNPTHIICGGASGADTISVQYAKKHGIKCTIYFPDWTNYGISAGTKRNTAMLEEKPDLVIATTGGPGTADMVRKSEKANFKVIRIP